MNFDATADSTSDPVISFVTAQLVPKEVEPAGLSSPPAADTEDGGEDHEQAGDDIAPMFAGLVRFDETLDQLRRGRPLTDEVLARIVGLRFVTARELNGWSQSEAALLLGYKNSTQLCLIEGGNRLPPHAILLAASEVYATSADFLLGISDEPERDPKQAERNSMLRGIRGLLDRSAELVAKALQERAGATVSAPRELIDAAMAVCATVVQFVDLNAEVFEDLRGGAKLVRTCEELQHSAAEALAVAERHRRIAENAISVARVRAQLPPLMWAAPHEVMPEHEAANSDDAPVGCGSA